MERLMRICLLTFAFCLLPFRLIHADTSPQQLFQQGNAAYAQGQFTQAISAYESARAQGLVHWALYYNLGNAYYKTNQTGKAIVNYERAFRLNSSQGDVLYNLNFSLSKAGDPLLPPGGLARLLWRMFFGLSLNMLTVFASLFFVGFCIGTTRFILGHYRPSGELALGVITTWLALSLWLGFRIALVQKHEAVVVVPTADVRSGPNLTYNANFTVPEGRRVLLLDEQEPIKGWAEIGIPSEGLKGWVPDVTIEAL